MKYCKDCKQFQDESNMVVPLAGFCRLKAEEVKKTDPECTDIQVLASVQEFEQDYQRLYEENIAMKRMLNIR